ncbi:nad6 (mitochondrion) [Ooceraea biroi]|uniref:Nad6 n=1 Tax=Ooceraea biroi TaxID=2015173 RepID=A0A3L8D2B3_OOCBI|nr:nad6 [Ooceraea biroi]
MTMLSFLILLQFFHPLILILIIMSFNILMIINMTMLEPFYLLPIMFFIIMISGLLIIFMYFSSLISNEKNSIFTSNPKMKLLLFTTLFTLTLSFKTIINYQEVISPMSQELNNNLMSHSFSAYFQNKSIYLYYPPMNNLTLMSMLFLLITLFTIIKICTPKSKTMRKLT